MAPLQRPHFLLKVCVSLDLYRESKETKKKRDETVLQCILSGVCVCLLNTEVVTLFRCWLYLLFNTKTFFSFL